MSLREAVRSSWRAAVPVAAFAALLLRPVLMARWPAPESSAAPVATLPVLVAAVALFVAGLLAVVARGAKARPGAGLALMTAAGVVAFAHAAWSRGGAAGPVVAVAVVATLGAVLARRLDAHGSASPAADAVSAPGTAEPGTVREGEAEDGSSNVFVVAVAVVAAALLAGVR